MNRRTVGAREQSAVSEPCPVLESLYSKHPDVMNREAYRDHIATCPHCRADEAVFKGFIEALGETGTRPQPSAHRQRQLMAAVRGRRSTSVDRRRPQAIRFAAAASVLIVAGGLAWYLKPLAERPASDVDLEPTVSVKRLVDGKTLLEDVTSPVLDRLATGAGEQLQIRVNRDELSVMEDTKLGITNPHHDQTRIRLESGTVHFAVSKRKGGESFVVEASPYSIRVVGTRFSVTRWGTEEMTVSVSAGQVVVSGPNTPIKQIASGEHFYFNNELPGDSPSPEFALNDAPAAPVENTAKSGEPDKDRSALRGGASRRGDADAARREPAADMDKWRRMIVAGAYTQAENEIHAHLAHRPNDWQAWSLLADCLRKERKWARSVASYQKLIRLAPQRAANRARLTASTVLQNQLGQHGEAAQLLEDYLRISDDSASLKAEIMVRLAKSYIKIRRFDRARQLLEKVVNGHRGNPIAKKAQGLLHRIASSSYDDE